MNGGTNRNGDDYERVDLPTLWFDGFHEETTFISFGLNGLGLTLVNRVNYIP